MADTVKVTLSAHHKGQKPGKQLELPKAEAKQLIRAGVAHATTDPEPEVGPDVDKAFDTP
ncbi:MAG: hypothetical protein AB7H43_10720 [Acidimicrobiia bacterium]